MSSNQKDMAKPTVSPVLFMNVDGSPMTFFLRPGNIKQELQPLITAGGGTWCKDQQPGAILLFDPKEKTSLPESSLSQYVSTQFIRDCVDNNEQLDLELYRLNPGIIQRHNTRHNSSSKGSSSGGRMSYTAQDNAAVLNYVRKRKAETGGNKLWKEMEQQGVTGHPWQSLKDHYTRLHKSFPEPEEMKAPSDDQIETLQDANAPKSSTEDEDIPPPKCSAKQDLEGDQLPPAQSTTEGKHILPACDPTEEQLEEAADGDQTEIIEAETLPVQTYDPCAEMQPITSETSQPDKDSDPTPASPQKDNRMDDSPSTPSETQLKATSSPKGTEKGKPESPARRVTRRQLNLKETSPHPERYSKRLRKSSPSFTSMSTTPKSPRKTKSLITASPQESSNREQPLPKKTRTDHEVETQMDTMEKKQPTETTSAAPKKAKRKEKRTLGILEQAAKEFEDEMEESDEDEGPDLLSDTVAMSTKAPILPSTQPESEPKLVPSPQVEEEVEEEEEEEQPPPQASSSPSEPELSTAETSASKAHLFIFDSESQAEVVGDNPVAPPIAPPTGDFISLSLTQAQLDQDMEIIRELMMQTNQDLVTVTKALLKSSGDVPAALNLLLNPSLVPGPFWTRSDDARLLSANAEVRRELEEKYGEKEVAKRIVFLEVEH